MTALRIGLAQANPTVGDLARNSELIVAFAKRAQEQGCDLVVFPELALTGYPPEDLLLKPAFLRDARLALEAAARQIKGIQAVVGTVDVANGKRTNAAAWIENGKIKAIYRKNRLPNYGVFDEDRYFSPGNEPLVRTIKGVRIGVTICEDIWLMEDHLKKLKAAKPHLTLNLSASPFHAGKMKQRQSVFKKSLGFLKTPLLYCNMVGGQDELVFDGGSFVSLANGKIAVQCPQFTEDLFVVDYDGPNKISAVAEQKRYPVLSGVEEIHHALVLGLRDYVRKNRFEAVTLGLSGGIDSALVAALAAEALGPERVIAVTMPSRFNLSETREDAFRLARNFNIRILEIPIQPVFESFLTALKPSFEGRGPDLTEENLQARIRGTLLMSLSNKFGWLVLTTGNKSETSTGYSTLYGDSAGGFAVIKDVLKTTVYAISRFINERAGKEMIPERIISRPPTAELRENQKDEDSLGPYAELDPVIVDYIEHNKSLDDMTRSRPGKGDHIRKLISLMDRAEYKRRQSPPGIKITPRSFGRDYRMPITNAYRDLPRKKN